MDWLLQTPSLHVVGVALIVLVILGLVTRRYQRCPHCGRMVLRAHRGWMRCRGCGRQYHRSVQLRK